MDEESKKIAAGLFALGVEKGDRVAIWGPNQSEWYIIKVNYDMSNNSFLKFFLQKVGRS